MDRHTYGDKNNDKDPDKSNDTIGNDKLVLKFSPHDYDEGVDGDGLML